VAGVGINGVEPSGLVVTHALPQQVLPEKHSEKTQMTNGLPVNHTTVLFTIISKPTTHHRKRRKQKSRDLNCGPTYPSENILYVVMFENGRRVKSVHNK
jgi:hypothetical protein